MASFNPKFTNIITVLPSPVKSLPKKCFNIQKFLSNVGRNVRANCALIANIISCTQWCLLKNESLKYDSFIYVFLLLARVTLTPHLLYIFSILVDVSCDVSVTPVDVV